MEDQIRQVVEATRDRVSQLFPGQKVDAILFGSHARGEATTESDVDIIFLVDSSREEISSRNWQLGKIASDIFFNYDLVVSPIVENRAFYEDRIETLPFYRNIHREGVKINA